eukprot:872624-Prorocentrum_minimum.AAC.1
MRRYNGRGSAWHANSYPWRWDPMDGGNPVCRSLRLPSARTMTLILLLFELGQGEDVWHSQAWQRMIECADSCECYYEDTGVIEFVEDGLTFFNNFLREEVCATMFLHEIRIKATDCAFSPIKATWETRVEQKAETGGKMSRFLLPSQCRHLVSAIMM